MNSEQALIDLVAPLWSASRALEALGITRTTMAARHKAGEVLALQTADGDFFYPVSQFEKHGGKVRVKPALRTLLMTLREHDPWAVVVILHTRAPELDDLTPLDWVRQGRDIHVLGDYAHVLDAEWSR